MTESKLGMEEGWTTKGHEETLGDEGYIYCLYCDGGFTGHAYIKTYQVVHFTYFVLQFYLKDV